MDRKDTNYLFNRAAHVASIAGPVNVIAATVAVVGGLALTQATGNPDWIAKTGAYWFCSFIGGMVLQQAAFTVADYTHDKSDPRTKPALP